MTPPASTPLIFTLALMPNALITISHEQTQAKTGHCDSNLSKVFDDSVNSGGMRLDVSQVERQH